MDDQEPQFELTESGFLALLVKHEPALRGYARGLVPDWDLVDEALQGASVTMWQKRGQLESADGFVPWARVILRFKCLRQLENLRWRRPILSDDMLETLAERGESCSVEDSTARERALHACLNQFSAEHKRARFFRCSSLSDYCGSCWKRWMWRRPVPVTRRQLRAGRRRRGTPGDL